MAPAWKRALPLLTIALLLLGTRLLLLAAFATPTPYMDQWTLAFALFTPLLNGTLTWHELLSSHVQHHILTTRLLDIGLLWLNHGVWNPMLEMVANALLHVTTLILLLHLLTRALPARQRPLLLAAGAALLVLPCGYANAIISFQSQIYFALLFSVVALWYLSQYPPLSPRWWLGYAAGLLAVLSFAAGAVTLAAATLLALVDGAPRRGRPLVAALLLLAATVAAVASTPLNPYDLMDAADASGQRPDIHLVGAAAGSLLDVLVSFYRTLSWPTIVLAPLLQWPLLRFLWQQWRQGAASPPARFVTGLGLWVLGVMVLIAGGRSVDPVISRYTDFFVVGLLLNAWCLLDGETPARWRNAWLLMVLTGLLVWTAGQLPLLRDAHLPQMQNSTASIRAYLATGDFTWLTPRRYAPLPPRPLPEEMRAILDIPAVRSILPPNLAPANVGRQAAWVSGLLANLRPLGWLLLTLCAACLPALVKPPALRR